MVAVRVRLLDRGLGGGADARNVDDRENLACEQLLLRHVEGWRAHRDGDRLGGVECLDQAAAQFGVIVVDDPSTHQYPMPKDAHEQDEVFVGRLRRDETQPKTLNMWVVSDNLRKGAATNAVQIAEYLAEKKML